MERPLSSEQVLSILIETLVNPSLAKVRPFGGAKLAELNISKQMEAVAWLYNRYLSQELSHLEALDWENICTIACLQQIKLSKFMRPSEFSGTHCLTLTEQKIKNACEVAASCQNSGNFRGNRMVTKVCVCLVNFRQDKCVLVLGATTVGLWSFIERSKDLQSAKDTPKEVSLSDEELAFQAVEEHTGLKPNVLQLRSPFLINDDLNGTGGSTKFFIMSCSGTFDLSCAVKVEKIAWVSIENVLPKAREPLIDTVDQSVRSTPAVQYFLLRPFCSSLENWLAMHKDVNLVQTKHGHKKVPATPGHQEVSLGRQQEVEDVFEPNREYQIEKSSSRIGGSPETDLCNEQKIQLVKLSPESLGMKAHIDVATTEMPQLLTEQAVNTDLLISSSEQTRAEHTTVLVENLEKHNQQHGSNVDSVLMETHMLIGSPRFSTLLTKTPELSSGNGGSNNDLATVAGKQGEDKLRLVHPAVDKAALSLNMSGTNDRPHLTRTKKREEEYVLDKAASLASLKTAYRNVRKRRKALSKELSKNVQQMDQLYNQIAKCDVDLATLIGGGKGALQLAAELCKKDVDKQMPCSDISVDDSQAASHAKCSLTDTAEASNKCKTFLMLKSSIQELNEVCTKNAWPMPSYGVFMHNNNHGENAFSGKVRIRTTTFELSECGESSCTSKKAKLSAAAYMLSTLHRLKASNGAI